MGIKVEFIESYIKPDGSADYIWNDNHGELIRCKDCKWHKTMYCKMDRWTDLVTVYVAKENDYCSYGERREDGRI